MLPREMPERFGVNGLGAVRQIARRARAAGLALRAGEMRVIGLALAIKTLVALSMLAFAHNYAALADAFNLHAYFPDARNIKHLWFTGEDAAAWSSWYLPLATWDSQHYLFLAEGGYDQNYDKTSGQQFYPLYPVLIRLLSTALPPVVSAIVLNYFLVAGFCVFLFRLAEHAGCPRRHLAVLIVMTYPMAFYTSALYNESLFLFLFLGFVYHLLVTRSNAQLVYLALLPTARGAALFVLGGLALHGALEYWRFLSERKAERRRWRKTAHGGKHGNRLSRAQTPAAAFAWRGYAACLLAYAAGVGAYLLFFQIAIGDAFAGVTAQARYPTGNSIANLFDPLYFLNNLAGGADVGKWFYPHGAWFDRLMLTLMLAAAAVFVVCREWTLLCFYFPQIYGHAAMGPISGFGRYTLLAAPFLALALVKHARRAWQVRLVYALCAAAFAVQLYLAARYSVNIWVS